MARRAACAALIAFIVLLVLVFQSEDAGGEPWTMPEEHRAHMWVELGPATIYEKPPARYERIAREQARERHELEHAAHTVWDSLAECESNQRWDINSGNGYSGGLQYHPQTWSAYRDQNMPAQAWQATREQQIAVAERVLEAQGWVAWPACSRKLGLR